MLWRLTTQPSPPAHIPVPTLALLSDIHGNLDALDAVLTHVRATAPHAARYHLGDLVGYAAEPDAVVARLDAEHIPGVAGNYDSTVAHGYRHCGCRSENAQQEALAHESFAWTLANTSAATKARLAALPFRLDVRPLGGHVAGPRVVLVHAHASSNLIYVTEDRPDDFLRKMGEAMGVTAGDLVAFGHTHKPWQRVVDGVHYVNTGSVGRPKDGDARAGYVLVEIAAAGALQVRMERVSYDVEAAAGKVIAAGLPTEFATVLRNGGKS
jgi:predicted phosphodiesterase